MKISRNQPCPCGSGKKYKDCCLIDSYYEEQFIKQHSLMMDLDDDSKAREVIEIGNKIIASGKTYSFTTGAYTNMANAYIHLDKTDGANNALSCLNKALKHKPSNLQALYLKYSVYMLNMEYGDAVDVLKVMKNYQIPDALRISVIESFQYGLNMSLSLGSGNDALKSVLDMIKEMFGEIAEVWIIAHEYYKSIGNDVIEAYNYGARVLDVIDAPEVCISMGFISLDERINKPDASEVFLKKVFDITSDQEQHFAAKTNLVNAYMMQEKFEDASTLAEELIKESPNNINYSNYAELLKRKGNYDEAAVWCRKALYLVEDDSTMLKLADIYKLNSDYEEAIQYYQKSIGLIEYNRNRYEFVDVNGIKIYSYATDEALDIMEKEAYIGAIESYNRLGEFNNAHAIHQLCMSKFPDDRSIQALNSILPKVDSFEVEMKAIIDTLENEKKEYEKRINVTKDWAADLIRLQNDFEDVELELEDNWEKFEKQMSGILKSMESAANKVDPNASILKHIRNEVTVNYSDLRSGSREFLITANYLYEINKTQIIDFAPIIVEYTKVVECQLRYKLGINSSDNRTLGQVIHKIKDEKIRPYNSILGQLFKINNLRRKAAHSSAQKLKEVEDIRRLLIEEKIIEKLV